MSTVGSAAGASKFVALARILLGFTSVFLFSHAMACYVSMHTDSVFATIIFNLLLILVGAVVAIIVAARTFIRIIVGLFRQRWLVSPALLACLALLVSSLYGECDNFLRSGSISVPHE
jgi:hypothetical protein